MGGQSLLPPLLFPGLLGPLQAAVGGLAGEGWTSGLGSRVDPTLLPGPPRPAQRLLGGPWGAGGYFPLAPPTLGLLGPFRGGFLPQYGQDL
ncbi:hypothetical protein TO73_2616 (plasmid) [Thermus aquaticus Y51MC23]|uniref:Elastin n=1 Tax=Thermus aquaticus (strain ATCC BAA-2747 / Y51MC23) TaxID=498848 RepID=A0ABM5VPT9_THEA5|nr:hypothetical protein TO73_2616 [Thermus aquaticus Y51MC23]